MEIFKQRAALRAFDRHPSVPMPKLENPFTIANPSAVTKVTEIQVVSETIKPEHDYANSDKSNTADSVSDRSFGMRSGARLEQQAPRIPASSPWPYPNFSTTQAQDDAKTTTTVTAGIPRTDEPCEEGVVRPMTSTGVPRRTAAVHANSHDTAAWGYAKVALLMFIAMFIVWVSSAYLSMRACH